MSAPIRKQFKRIPRLTAVGVLRIYQAVISPIQNVFLCPGGCCRFFPSCSEYAIQSIKLHGLFRGGCYSLWRLGKCHPFNRGGFDPVKAANTPYQTLSGED